MKRTKTTKNLVGQIDLPIVVPCTISTVQDPYWDEITAEPSTTQDRWNSDDFGECPRKVASDGQLEIFFDDSNEPPDPDDYSSLADYELAWQQWQSVGEQLKQTTKIAPQHTLTNEPVGEQTEDTIIAPQRLFISKGVGEQLGQTSIAPQHPPKHTHWVEKYWVERGTKKHYYWRYMWMEGRKMRRSYLGRYGDRVRAVQQAIAEGMSPLEIQQMIANVK
jgi:hypothetical protein